MRNALVLLTSSLFFSVLVASSAAAVDPGAISGTDATTSSAAESPTAPVALITGSDRGIGLALTREFVARGWRVVATCRNPDAATELRAFAAKSPGVTIERLDVADNAAIDALSVKLREQPIDALINNAGVTGEFSAQSLAVLEPAEFQRVLRINTYAPKFIENALVYYYVISKAGLNMSMRLLAAEMKSRGVIVGIVTPGRVETDMQVQYRAASAAMATPITDPA